VNFNKLWKSSYKILMQSERGKTRTRRAIGMSKYVRVSLVEKKLAKVPANLENLENPTGKLTNLRKP
jgi:hypothetical protein